MGGAPIGAGGGAGGAAGAAVYPAKGFWLGSMQIWVDCEKERKNEINKIAKDSSRANSVRHKMMALRYKQSRSSTV